MGSGRSAVLAVCGALCVGALALGALPTAAANPRAPAPRWRVVARTPGTLDAVIAPAATSAWAFGWGANPPSGPIFAIARHWDGRHWSRVQFPKGVRKSGMSCAGATTQTDAWAVSGTGVSASEPPSTVSALRLRAGRWVIVKDFPGNFVTGCNVLGPTDVWVFGGVGAGLGRGIGTWHLRGSTWTQVKTGNLVLVDASAVSPADVWAIGGDFSHSPFLPVLARWNGRSWHQIRSISQALPKPASMVGLDAVNAISARDVWVLAEVIRHSARSLVVLHWTGRAWSRVRPGGSGYYLPTAVPDGHGGWWSVPYVPGFSVHYLLHRAHGRWTRFPLPVPLAVIPGGPVIPSSGVISLVHVPHTSAMLAAGTQFRHGGASSVILAFGRLPA
jgi:hypothetical protein